MQTSIVVDLALIDYDDRLIRDLEHQFMTAAQPHAPQRRERLWSGPGIGRIASLVWLYEISAWVWQRTV
ncbi:MAG TPA: hypothetical protein VGC99_11665 [Candidatus Tectomicrobia bacterium]